MSFYWVIPSFTGFYWVLLFFCVYQVELGLTWFYREFCRVLSGFTWIYLVISLNLTVFLVLTWFKWVKLGFIGYYRVLPSFTRFQSN